MSSCVSSANLVNSPTRRKGKQGRYSIWGRHLLLQQQSEFWDQLQDTIFVDVGGVPNNYRIAA